MKTFTGTKTEITQFLYKLDKDTIWDIKIDKHRNKRSLDANNYSWALQTEIANELRLSKEEVHFEMLKSYGQRDYITMLADVNISDYYNYYEEISTYRKNGNTFKSYMIYRGTHTYNSKEMAIFIDGLVQEAKQLDIETLEDKEIRELIKYMEETEK